MELCQKAGKKQLKQKLHYYVIEVVKQIFLYQTSRESYDLTAELMQIPENQKGLNKITTLEQILNNVA